MTICYNECVVCDVSFPDSEGWCCDCGDWHCDQCYYSQNKCENCEIKLVLGLILEKLRFIDLFTRIISFSHL